MPNHIDGGNVGYLTVEQFDRFRWAMEDSRTLIPWLRVAGYVRTGEYDVRVQSSSQRPLGLPPTWIAAEDILRLQYELNQWRELEDAANDEYGAWVAVTFTDEVRVAAAKWPLEDKPHRVRYMRCGDCGGLTLRYHPPRRDGDRVMVKCSDQGCGMVMDEESFTVAAGIIERENELRRLGDRERRRRNVGSDQEDDSQVGGFGEGADVAANAGAVA